MEVIPSKGSRVIVAFFTIVFWGMGVRGLHNLEINVPNAVLVGETVTLECSWQLEDEEALYSVKWYRGREEFYRYIPKELPHTRVFPLPGIEVDISRSGARRVVLQQATPAMAGRFRCEVSADAPTFHTEIRSAPLEVVEPPEWGPKLVSDRSWYGVGSTLRATCASPPAQPPANLTFALNGREIDMEFFGHELPSWFKWDPPPKPETTTTDMPEDDVNFNIFHDESNIQYLDETYINLHKEEIRRPPKESLKAEFERTGPDNRLVSVGEVVFVVRHEAFERGSLRLTCIASMYNLYAARAELIFDMEQPEVASVLGVRNSAEELCHRIDCVKLISEAITMRESRVPGDVTCSNELHSTAWTTYLLGQFLVAAEKGCDLSCLKHIAIGGSAIQKELLSKFRTQETMARRLECIQRRVDQKIDRDAWKEMGNAKCAVESAMLDISLRDRIRNEEISRRT